MDFSVVGFTKMSAEEYDRLNIDKFFIDHSVQDGYVKIYKEYESYTGGLSDLIEDFIDYVADFDDDRLLRGLSTHVGVFYNVVESITFTIKQSASNTQKLGKYGMSLDVTYYPCDESHDVNES